MLILLGVSTIFPNGETSQPQPLAASKDPAVLEAAAVAAAQSGDFSGGGLMLGQITGLRAIPFPVLPASQEIQTAADTHAAAKSKKKP